MKRSRLLRLTLAFTVLILLGMTWSALAECQYCWKESPSSGGICLSVVNPNPSLATFANCQGGFRCRTGALGTICWPDCSGNPCYWV